MKIKVRGARENNLQDIDVDIGDGLTVVTGVSGSGKTSLVFDTIYKEARRRFLNLFGTSGSENSIRPVKIRSLTGIGPVIAVEQDVLNRNPLSTLATASGIHPFLRILFARFGTRHCPKCENEFVKLSGNEILQEIVKISNSGPISIIVPLVRNAYGSHRTLIELLVDNFDSSKIIVDGDTKIPNLDPSKKHSIHISLSRELVNPTSQSIRDILERAWEMGSNSIIIKTDDDEFSFSRTSECSTCGFWLGEIEPTHFHRQCTSCEGKGCVECASTGLTPKAAYVKWNNHIISEYLSLTVDEIAESLNSITYVSAAERVISEILRRILALKKVGLGYLQLDRSSPTLSRGESQRVRLAISLTGQLEDITHILDEPTIGQHPADVGNLVKAFSELKGPVIFVEHDRSAAAQANTAIDLGPGAGKDGGKTIFRGTPKDLWNSETTTGKYFSFRKRVKIPEKRDRPTKFIIIKGAMKHNLKEIDTKIPLGRLTVVTGKSGSGKSTLVEYVLTPSLKKKKPIGCASVSGPKLKPVIVDQKPIGKNPRSNPGTYSKLSDIIRDLYSTQTGLSTSHFSFNRPEGACPVCKGMGATEVKMTYLPSEWITCSECEGERFKDEILEETVHFTDKELSIADIYNLSIREIYDLFKEDGRIPEKKRVSALKILSAMVTVGLGYLKLGQPSPTLSGGESQRVKLAKYLGKRSLKRRLLVLDEPSTGLHPADLAGLLKVLDKLVRDGATVVVVEHNTDIIRAADWIIDLGPEGGPQGGQVLFQGPYSEFLSNDDSYTAQAIRDEESLEPISEFDWVGTSKEEYISIVNARANNLNSVNVDIPKGKLTVVTGVSGSGKSSLVHDVLESEAKKRYLESLSVYERQGVKEGPEAPVDSISGLGVTAIVGPHAISAESTWTKWTRSTVGTHSGIYYNLARLFSKIGEKTCLKCGNVMERTNRFECPKCGNLTPLARPRHFSQRTYAAACPECNGLGTISIPVPEKLIIHPDKPICKGAMYSPGFFPKGFLCKPYNSAYYELRVFAQHYGFDPDKTPWNEMTEEAQHAFLFGSEQEIDVTYENRAGKFRTKKTKWAGFYIGFVTDWDIGDTYNRTENCPKCKGSGLRDKYLKIKLAGYNIHELSLLPLNELLSILQRIPKLEDKIANNELTSAKKRLEFLSSVGLAYLHLKRIAGSLSAGEAQRISLAGILGSGLTSMTILMDEPTRGMHPSEVASLAAVLQELRHNGNTVVCVEHDPTIIKSADEIIDIGPGSGKNGGEVVALGSPELVAKSSTITAQWLSGKKSFNQDRKRKEPTEWMTIKGARENNLQNISVRIPLGVLVGICGVSGSGKSTLILDTIGRKIAPKKHTTSTSREPTTPGEFDSIEGAPNYAYQLGQARKGITSPARALGLFKPLAKLYSESEDAHALGLDNKQITKACDVCNGDGLHRIDMGFLPDVFTECETCKGSGYGPDAWDVKLKGVSLPELNNLTLQEVYDLFSFDSTIKRKIKPALDVGLGYLVLHQPGISLSGGERQRLRITQELAKRTRDGTLYILDEPTVGLHLDDVNNLVEVLHELVDSGASVIVVDHHSHLLCSCDWLIELGPEGGPKGGKIIAEGTPEQIAKSSTPSAPYLKEVLEGKQ
ncbi:MAG: ATP-binding cassette domain-containing protein [Candidatus Lokiarchaeota archaeon]|nr:ATP-binding cassette domain-containing protein [Candidatus Lokiarchaeota archaeon]